MTLLQEFMVYLTAAIIVVAVVSLGLYMLVRVATAAYFRSKQQFDQPMRKNHGQR